MIASSSGWPMSPNVKSTVEKHSEKSNRRERDRVPSICGHLPGSVVSDRSDSVLDSHSDCRYENEMGSVAATAVVGGSRRRDGVTGTGGSSGLHTFYAFETSNDPPMTRLPPQSFLDEEDFGTERSEFIVAADDTIYKRLVVRYLDGPKSSISLAVIRLFLKIIACALYVLRVSLDHQYNEDCVDTVTFRCPIKEAVATTMRKTVNWEAIFRINFYFPVWLANIIVAAITLLLTTILMFLQFKKKTLRVSYLDFVLELAISIPTLLTLLPELRNFFVPIFLNCWLARLALKDLFSHRSLSTYSNFNLKLVDVMATLFCIVFMGFEHLQRGSLDLQYDLFQSFYFIVVTLTTVGYGDYYPDIWPTQLCMIAIIGVAFFVLPKQFESLAWTWVEMQRLGGSYRKKGHLMNDKHVVVCSTKLTDDLVTNFLSEFFANQHLQNFHVVFLASSDLDPKVRRILQLPTWAHRNTFIRGSCLRDEDLQRTQVDQAEACFFLGADNSVDKIAADQHTILRSWAIKDFAPSVPQYVQIFRPENIVHINFAEHIVCEDEFKYAMLAYNCMIPGTSTLMTLLLHTSRGREGEDAKEPWLRLYGKCSGNEVYHIVVEKSKLFGRFVGRSFSYAAVRAHRMFGVSLIGLQPQEPAQNGSGVHIMLNPGSGYFMRRTDVCFYLSVTKEEDLVFESRSPMKTRSFRRREAAAAAAENRSSNKLQVVNNLADKHARRFRKNSFGKKPNGGSSEKRSYSNSETTIGYPPVTPYVGTSPNLCYLVKEQRPLCCLQLDEECKHCHFRNAKDYEWTNRVIIMAADHASLGIYNFVVPLRAYFHRQDALNPIVLLLEKRPDRSFMNSMSWFPDVFWMLGSIDNLDDLLRSGIDLADNVVVVNRETSNAGAEEEDLSDCNTIVGVQTVFKYFPNVKITTELSQSSNMRFMHFQANNAYALHLAQVEKHEKEKGSIISFMFRLQFASGIVFSAGMVDTLLYQAFFKDFLIPIVRLILGIDQAPGSAYLTSIEVDMDEPWMATYGSVFAQLCSFNGDVPIAVFRTQYEVGIGSPAIQDKMPDVRCQYSEHEQIANLIKSRMSNLDMRPLSSSSVQPITTAHKVSYVIINPDFELPLQDGDILFLLRPPS